MLAWIESGAANSILSVALDTCDSLTEHSMGEFLKHYGHQLTGLNLGGIPQFVENFWVNCLPKLRSVRIIIMGIGTYARGHRKGYSLMTSPAWAGGSKNLAQEMTLRAKDSPCLCVKAGGSNTINF